MSRYIELNKVLSELGLDHKDYVYIDKHEVAERIKKLPTIEPKQGEWIIIDTKVVSVPVYWNEEQRQSDERGAGIQEKCKCSACGWITNFVGYKKLGVNKPFNFCPNCGADMRKEGE